MRLLLFIGCTVLLVLVGTQHLFFPRQLRERELRDLDEGIGPEIPFARRFLESRWYILHSRIFGLACYLIAALFLIGILNHGRIR